MMILLYNEGTQGQSDGEKMKRLNELKIKAQKFCSGIFLAKYVGG